MKNRAQCSLIFADDEIFDNLITPLKASKALNEFLVKLVTIYYNDERVQSIVDEGIVVEDKEAEQKRAEMYTAINESLAVMEYLADEGKNIVEDGASMLESVLAGAEESGMATHEESDVGDGFTKFNIGIPKKESKETESIPTTEEHKDDDRVTKLEGEVSTIKDMLLELQRSITNLGSLGAVAQSTAEKVNTTSTGSVVTDVSNSDDNLSYSVDEEEEVSVEVKEKATNDMLELLGSI